MRFKPSVESEKLDLNLASETTISSFFRALSLDPDEANAFAARIADWRDADDLARPNGAERRDYMGARNGEKIGDRPFYSVDELSLVLDAPEKIVACALPALTIFGDGSPPSTALMQNLFSADIDRSNQTTEARLGTASLSAAAGRRYAIDAIVAKEGGKERRPHALTGVFRITGGRQKPFEWIARFEALPDRNRRSQCAKDRQDKE